MSYHASLIMQSINAKAKAPSEPAKTTEAEEMVESAFLLSHYARAFFLPPGVPQQRVELIRDAFWKTMQDPNPDYSWFLVTSHQ